MLQEVADKQTTLALAEFGSAGAMRRGGRQEGGGEEVEWGGGAWRESGSMGREAWGVGKSSDPVVMLSPRTLLLALC